MFDVYSYRGCWYGIPTCDEAFDPVKAKAGFYDLCLRCSRIRQLYVLAAPGGLAPDGAQAGENRIALAPIISRALLRACGFRTPRPRSHGQPQLLKK